MANKLEGTATNPRPIKTISVENNFPPVVIGYISPYPTVVIVTIAHQNADGIDVN